MKKNSRVWIKSIIVKLLHWINEKKIKLNKKDYIKSKIAKWLHWINKTRLNWIKKIKSNQKLQWLNFATNGQPYKSKVNKNV